MTGDPTPPFGSPASAVDQAGFTVLIADDDPDIAGLMEIAVRRAGGSVVAVANDGDQALARIRDLQPDLALLDVSMPGLSGVEVCRLVREPDPNDLQGASAERPGTMIVLLSAAVHPEAVANGLRAGAERYLAKPFSPRALAVQLQEVVQAKGIRP